MKTIFSCLVVLFLLSSGAAAKNLQHQDWRTCAFLGN